MEPAETQSLRLAIERSLRGAFDPADVLPRLARLARLAAPSSDDGVFANHKLAELLVERDPWRAALYIRRALKHRPNDDRPWAILAFCQTLLGNFRCAATAYKKAIACAPSNPWYAHNLGHLLDVALGEPSRAVDWLKLAYNAKSDNSEIVASYAHALARASRVDEARQVLERARGRFNSKELDALVRWLDQGAPARGNGSAARAHEKAQSGEKRSGGGVKRVVAKPPRGASSPTAKKKEPRHGAAMPRRLARILSRGLSHLPLDEDQRERALDLARDALPGRSHVKDVKDVKDAAVPVDVASTTSLKPPPEDVAGLAAAVAYAIVFIDHIPLSQAEVAAPFRVGVAQLRGRFAELRARLDIIRGDARYATRFS